MSDELSANPKVVILGEAKSGTTGLFYLLKNSMPENTRYLFEPKNYEYIYLPEDDSRPVLAKILFGNPANFNYASFSKFGKKLFILRDPRDRVVSEMLFWVCESTFWSDKDKLNAYMELLKRKENDPGSISFIELVKIGRELSDDNFKWKTWATQVSLRFSIIETYLQENTDYFLVKYEDFVAKNLSSLEEYLGFPLAGEAVVEGWADIVVRTKASGDWRNWFTAADVQYFEPLMSVFLSKFGFSTDWQLLDTPLIKKEFCTDYVNKTLEKKKKRMVIPPKNKGAQK